jgi:GT2 family glycosyltransferase
MHNTCSVIIFYKGDEKKVFALSHVLSKFSHVIIFDNSQTLNTKIFRIFNNVEIINLYENIGTARAYNHAISNYIKFKYFWLWDQDTIITEKICNEFYKKSITLFKINNKLVATTFLDKKNFISPINKQNILIKASTTLIQIDRINNLKNNVFENDLFMDYVDWLFAQKIYTAGFEIIQIPIKEYKHEFGEKENTIFGDYSRSSEIRLYMQALNSMYIFKNIGLLNFLSILLFFRILFIPFKNLIFKNSFKRTSLFLKGLFDGFHGIKSDDFIHKISKTK